MAALFGFFAHLRGGKESTPDSYFLCNPRKQSISIWFSKKQAHASDSAGFKRRIRVQRVVNCSFGKSLLLRLYDTEGRAMDLVLCDISDLRMVVSRYNSRRGSWRGSQSEGGMQWVELEDHDTSDEQHERQHSEATELEQRLAVWEEKRQQILWEVNTHLTLAHSTM